jgi:hypothetical protein
MVFCIIRENKRIINKFDFGTSIDTSIYPLQDGSIVLKKPLDDCCSICFENFDINDKVVQWPGCKHPYHSACYKVLRVEHNILSCPTCRNKIEKVTYQKRFSYLGYGYDYDDSDDDHLFKEKYNDVNCFYVDKQGNLNIRYIIFCKKYNFNIEEDIFRSRFININVLTLFNLVALVYREKSEDISSEEKINISEQINYLLDIILEKYVISQNKKLVKKHYEIISENLNTFSNIFNVNLLSYLENKMCKVMDSLISTEKKTLNKSLETFIFTTEGKIWFYENSLNERKKFYQEKLSKIGGEKYRKIFMSENIEDFIQNINIIK